MGFDQSESFLDIGHVLAGKHYVLAGNNYRAFHLLVRLCSANDVDFTPALISPPASISPLASMSPLTSISPPTSTSPLMSALALMVSKRRVICHCWDGVVLFVCKGRQMSNQDLGYKTVNKKVVIRRNTTLMSL